MQPNENKNSLKFYLQFNVGGSLQALQVADSERDENLIQQQSEQTLELAEYYLEKYKVKEENFGLGLVLDSEDYKVFAGPTVQLDGSIILGNNKTNYLDCKNICCDIYKDIITKNPELKPRIMYYNGGYMHYWIEISDPKTKARVQIDPTPWYSSLNPGHVGNPTDNNKIKYIVIGKKQGRPLSVRRINDKHITTVISAFLPKTVYKQESLRANENNSLIDGPYEKAEYRFIIWSFLSKALNSPEKNLYMYINVLDTNAVQKNIERVEKIEQLFTMKGIEIGFTYKNKKGYKNDTNFGSLNSMRDYADLEDKKELFYDIEKNIPRIIKLLKRLGTRLYLYEKPNNYVEVNEGIMHTLEDKESGNLADYSNYKALSIMTLAPLISNLTYDFLFSF